MTPVRRSHPHVARALALVMTLATATPACARKTRAAKHGTEQTAAAAAPTPDNTPVPALRTPAGLVLKVEEPAPATAAPATTPAATSSPKPTP